MSGLPRVLDFAAWQDAALESFDPREVVECPGCDGAGSSSCSECGHDTECGDCAGYGERALVELEPHQLRAYFNESKYLDAVLADLSALADWVGRDRFEVFLASGFRPYSVLRSKSVAIEGAA